MHLADLEGSLAELPQPCLSVYLEATGAASNGRSTANLRPWIKKLAKTIEARMSAVEAEAFRTQLDRVEAFLRTSAPRRGALAIFSAPAKWICLPLPPSVSNELSWGRPSLAQLWRIAAEQQEVYIVAVDRAGARFFHWELGDLTELPAMKFEVDVSQWKRKEHGHMARRNTRMPHGPLRDAFKRRMDKHYQQFFHQITERTKSACATADLRGVLLVGSERLTKPIQKALPLELQERTMLVPEDLARIAPAKLQATIQPRIVAWMRRFAEARATRLIESTRGVVVGIDETLAELQQGHIGTLLMVRGFDVLLRQCANCGDVNRSADPVCAMCHGSRREVMLSQVLDSIAKDHHTKVEILDPDAAQKLAKGGGMGGWLRQSSSRPWASRPASEMSVSHGVT